MKTEMSYRDKVILVIVLIIAILAVGFFVLIKPKYEDLQTHKKTRDTKKSDWEAVEMKLDQIDPLKETITKERDAAADVAKIFVNSAFANANETLTNEKNAYQIDQYIQPAIDKSKLEVKQMELGSTTTKTIKYYYYTPDVLTYSLLEAADINGNYAEKAAEALLETVLLSGATTADVMSLEVTLNVTGSKEQLMTFLGEIEKDGNAVLVTGVNVNDYTFSGGLDEEEENNQQQFDEEGNPIPQTPSNDDEELEPGTSNMTIILNFYNAVAIDEPVLGD